MLHFITHALEVINNVPASAGITSLFALIASLVMSPTLQFVKHWLSVQSDKLMFALVVITSGGIATAHYLLSTPSTNPSIVALQTALLTFAAQPVYFYLVKPLYTTWLQSLSEAKQLTTHPAQSAIEPATGVPFSSATVNPDPAVNDFAL